MSPGGSRLSPGHPVSGLLVPSFPAVVPLCCCRLAVLKLDSNLKRNTSQGRTLKPFSGRSSLRG